MASWSLQSDTNARSQVEPDPRPPKRLRASTEAWSDIHKEFEHACCVSCGLPYESLHHVVPRSQNGDDMAENLAPMCGDGTRGCHGLLESHAAGWERVAAAVRVYVLTNRGRCSYVIGKIGWDRFSHRYPLLSEGESLLPGVRVAPELPGLARRASSAASSESTRSPSESDEPIWRYHPVELEPERSESVEGHG